MYYIIYQTLSYSIDKQYFINLSYISNTLLAIVAKILFSFCVLEFLHLGQANLLYFIEMLGHVAGQNSK